MVSGRSDPFTVLNFTLVGSEMVFFFRGGESTVRGVGVGNWSLTFKGCRKSRSGCLVVACLDRAEDDAYFGPHHSHTYSRRCLLCLRV